MIPVNYSVTKTALQLIAGNLYSAEICFLSLKNVFIFIFFHYMTGQNKEQKEQDKKISQCWVWKGTGQSANKLVGNKVNSQCSATHWKESHFPL